VPRIQDPVTHDSVNEVIHYGSNRIYAAEAFVQRGFGSAWRPSNPPSSAASSPAVGAYRDAN